MLFVHRTKGVAAAALGVLALGACSDPELNTDLRPEGPPDVLAVLVMSDALSQLVETATYCKSGDELRPTLVGLPDFTTQQVCPDEGSPDPVDSAYPDGWYVRIMFDELLDPTIEELTPIIDAETGEETGSFSGSIAGTRPVELECRSVTNNQFVRVDYDGYYSPSGNRVTWPVGPSLVVKPNDPTMIATNTECQITLNANILDKEGLAVPEGQRGPFPFKVSGIKAIVLDPPVDDPDYESPVDAVTIYYDNIYVQFNTAVDISTLSNENESVFSITDDAHPAEGPGYCNNTGNPCGTVANCDAGMGDTFCARGYCGATGDFCNKAADCPTPDDYCGTTYVYDYVVYGGTDTEFGIGPNMPIETDRKYTFQFKAGAKLKDRCGRETTLPTPDIPGDATDTATTADDNLYARFITETFALNSTTIVTDEVANANKRLQFNFNNVVKNADGLTSDGTAIYYQDAIDTTSATPAFTISPLPKKLTAACSAGTCATADLTPAELLIVSPNYDGQIQLQGHLQMNTEYTATLKQGTLVEDFYGKTWTVADEDLVIKWKTQPAIVMTGIAVRSTGTAFSITDQGTVTRLFPGQTTDVRFSFNASIDPTTFTTADFKIEPPVPGLSIDVGPDPADPADDVLPSGCGYYDDTEPEHAGAHNATGWLAACTLRARGFFPAGQYKITFLKDAKVKDIFGLEYTHPADTTITIQVEDAPAVGQCL